MKIFFLTCGISIINNESGDSAEIATLAKFQEKFGDFSDSDLCVIFPTDTPQSRKAAELLVDVIEKRFRLRTKTIVVDGLSVTNIDNNTFLKIIRSFAGEVSNVMGQQPNDAEFYVISTTGHKIISSLLTLIGLLHNFTIVYLYEGENEILTFPNIRVKLSPSIWLDNYLFFKKLILFAVKPSDFKNSDGILSELKPFVYIQSNKLTLTGLGNLLKKQVIEEYCDERLGIPFVWKRKFVEDCFLKHVREDRFSFVLLIDIDHFKRINDNYGHSFGDKILSDFSKGVVEFLRNVGVLDYTFPPEFIRWGGEEFVIVGQTDDINNVKHLASQIRSYVEDKEIPIEGSRELKITISIGVAVGRLKSRDLYGFNELFKLADKCLYKAKESGRNLICMHDDGCFK